MSFIGRIIGLYMKREGRKHPLSEWPGLLAASQQTMVDSIQAASDTEKNQSVARHFIGIERWSQSRLRVFLGGELVMDEYDAYQPTADLDMAALADQFVETRQETVGLAQELCDAGITDDQTVPHNDMGDVSARTWLAYIRGHAQQEAKRFK